MSNIQRYDPTSGDRHLPIPVDIDDEVAARMRRWLRDEAILDHHGLVRWRDSRAVVSPKVFEVAKLKAPSKQQAGFEDWTDQALRVIRTADRIEPHHTRQAREARLGPGS